ncbi:MAG TPA: hypothetical protein VJ227_02115 [Patescibacteria group bacterium]|nr:hypothetical protein [Patescibacteria group bacterium]
MLFEIIGWGGTAVLLVAYFLVSAKKIDAGSKTYQFLNLFGALAVGVNSFLHAAYPSVGINLAWMAIAVWALARYKKLS